MTEAQAMNRLAVLRRQRGMAEVKAAGIAKEIAVLESRLGLAPCARHPWETTRSCPRCAPETVNDFA